MGPPTVGPCPRQSVWLSAHLTLRQTSRPVSVHPSSSDHRSFRWSLLGLSPSAPGPQSVGALLASCGTEASQFLKVAVDRLVTPPLRRWLTLRGRSTWPLPHLHPVPCRRNKPTIQASARQHRTLARRETLHRGPNGELHYRRLRCALTVARQSAKPPAWRPPAWAQVPLWRRLRSSVRIPPG